MARLRLARGQDVFRVGEPCEEFHVVVTGQVKLFGLSPAGQGVILRTTRLVSFVQRAVAAFTSVYDLSTVFLTARPVVSWD